jgi:hypothetical protein
MLFHLVEEEDGQWLDSNTLLGVQNSFIARILPYMQRLRNQRLALQRSIGWNLFEATRG